MRRIGHGIATPDGELLVYRVRGNGFLHHMVRNLVGTMIDVGRGHLALEGIPAILAARSRSTAGPTAPARGLFLHSVDYPADEAVHVALRSSASGPQSIAAASRILLL